MKFVDVIHNTLNIPMYHSELFRKLHRHNSKLACYYGRRWYRCYDMVVVII